MSVLQAEWIDRSSERAAAAAVVLRVRRARRARGNLYRLYVAVLAVAVYGALASRVISSAVGPGLPGSSFEDYWPAALALVLLLVVRTGAWQGPVSFAPADVAFLLSAPILVRHLVAPRLRRGFGGAASLGAGAGVVTVFASRAGFDGLGGGRSVATVLAFALLGLLALGLSWQIERSRDVARIVLRYGWVVVIGCGVLLALGVAVGGSVGRSVALWSGPWGWTVVALTGVKVWWLGLALDAVVAALVAVASLRGASSVATERFLDQAQTRSTISGSASALNYRSAVLAQRQAVISVGGRSASGFRLGRPRRRWAVVPWRDVVSLLRTPRRFAMAAVLGGGAVLEAVEHPGRILPAALTSLLLYFAAGALLEPMRIDVDVPERGRLLLGFDYGRLLVRHCLVPFVVLALVEVVAVLTCCLVGAGGASSSGLGVIVVAVPETACAVLFAALGARGGGRVGLSSLEWISRLGAGDPTGGATAILFIAPWLLAGLVGLSVPVLIAGHAARHAHTTGAVATGWIGAGALAVGIASGLLTTLQRSTPG